MDLSPILVIDDDQDDLELIKDVANHLKIERPIIYFSNGDELLTFLNNTDVSPFLIISDVSLPGQNGFEIKKRITESIGLKYKSVPFIYMSNSASEKQIQYAYDLPAQGFFIKAGNFDEFCNAFKTILSYWDISKHPKKVK